MKQADDFLTECHILSQLLAAFKEDALDAPTGFKSWTANQIIRHLHFWNLMADLSLTDPKRSESIFEKMPDIMDSGGLRDFEANEVPKSGSVLLEDWQQLYQDMATRWAEIDPKMRLLWAGPTMSARTSISARQMETWAHGQALFDLAGKERSESDRLHNVVMLGVNAFGWNMRVQELGEDREQPELRLLSPEGQEWYFQGKGGFIEGSALSFCQLVTQTRNLADTDIQTQGETAGLWMANAQCFAGPKETPPPPGARVKVNNRKRLLRKLS